MKVGLIPRTRLRAAVAPVGTAIAAALMMPALTGCVTVADFRKLEREVIDLKRGGGAGGPGSNTRVADLAVRLDALERETQALSGRIEVAEHRADSALEEARAARQQAATLAAVPVGIAADPDAAANGVVSPGAAAMAAGGGSDLDGAAAEELAAYREAREQWRRGEWADCVDRLGEFLQTYPSSAYADDAAYWRADCYFKQGNLQRAILRFDDVVVRYPEGNKAPDALYRQGEALLRLGHNAAARKAFERVVDEYPDSERVSEARQQLTLLRE